MPKHDETTTDDDTHATHSASSSARSSIDSIDSIPSGDFRPETLVEESWHRRGSNATGSRRFSVSSRTSANSRSSRIPTRMDSIVESIRDDNAQTYEEERRQQSTDAGVLRREWTLNDALSKIETEAENKELSQEQERNKNLGYTTEELLDPPPDGGFRAWSSAFGVALLSFSTWGINSAYGVFLSYYISTDYFPGATSLDFALIGSIVVGVSQFVAPFVIILMKVIGFREVLIVGTIIQTVSYILASFATKIWHLYMTQGFMTGISFAFIFCPATMVIPTWFLHKRGFANGISLSGSGLGGVVFSLSINKLIEQTGDQKWSLRMLAIIGFVLCAFCIIFVKPRNYQKPRANWKTLKLVSAAIFDMSAWREPSTVIIAVWLGISNMSYTIVLFSVSSYAVAVGLTSAQASALTAILNAGQTIGRPTIGFVADKVGRINYCIGGIGTMVILIFAFWLNARSYASLIVFCFISGFFLPVANTLNQPLMADAIEPSRFPAAFALVFVNLGIFAFPCEVIGMELRTPDNERFPYLWCQVLTGLLYTISVAMMFPLRQIKIQKMLSARRETTGARLEKIEKGHVTGVSDEELEREADLLARRLATYDNLLKPGVRGYVARTLYPIKA